MVRPWGPRMPYLVQPNLQVGRVGGTERQPQVIAICGRRDTILEPARRIGCQRTTLFGATEFVWNPARCLCVLGLHRYDMSGVEESHFDDASDKNRFQQRGQDECVNRGQGRVVNIQPIVEMRLRRGPCYPFSPESIMPLM